MLCEALKRTEDVRAPDVLIESFNDDDVAGHAISVVRSFGPKKAVPLLREAEPNLKDLAQSATSTTFARTQARRALAQLSAASG
jgi:hypothetical protein